MSNHQVRALQMRVNAWILRVVDSEDEEELIAIMVRIVVDAAALRLCYKDFMKPEHRVAVRLFVPASLCRKVRDAVALLS